MQVLDRLKMELSNQEYFSDEQYIQFALEIRKMFFAENITYFMYIVENIGNYQ